MAQNHAAKTQIDLHVKEFRRIAVPQYPGPERHHLHVTARTNAGHGKLAKGTFDLNQAQYQCRFKAGAPTLVPDRLQKFLSGFQIRLAAA